MTKQIDIEAIGVKRWLNEKEASIYSGFGREILRRFRTKGSRRGIVLKHSVMNGNIRYDKYEIDKFMESHIVEIEEEAI